LKIALAEDMRRMDRLAVEKHGLTVEHLMESAAAAVVEALDEFPGTWAKRTVGLVCGKGNNGGDGLAAARLLRKKKASVVVLLRADPGELEGETAKQYAKAKAAKVPVIPLRDEGSLKQVPGVLGECDLVVDALFGTGLSRAVTGMDRDLIRLMNASGKPIVAVDIPSGLDADTGEARGEAVKARKTVTFGLPKAGFFTAAGRPYVGSWSVAEIGFPQELLEDPAIKMELLDAETVRRCLPKFDGQTHKGTRGRVVLVAGATGLTGAATLSALGAQRVGAGLVTVACAESLNAILEVKLTEPMTAPVPEVPGGFLSSKALGRILSLAAKVNAVVLGPGVGRHHETGTLMKELVLKLTAPMVVDADALNLLGGQTDVFRAARAPVIVTPHPGEAAGLLKTTIPDVESRRLAVAKQIAREYNVTAILKGPWTVVASPSGEVRINPTGNRALGTAGTGDVLSGILGGLLAQRLSPFDAAAVGVYVHGLAGERASKKLGLDGVLAGDLLPEIPRVLRRLRNEGQA